MRIKHLLSIGLLLLLSVQTHGETAIPADLLSEIRSAAKTSEGDIIYIDFWASWCKPCRKSFPWMNAMHKKYQTRGFKVLAVNVDKERALADKFLKNTPTEFPIFYDPEGRLAKAFKLQGMPSSFMIDDKGQILSAHKGFFESRTPSYEKEIQSLLTQYLPTRQSSTKKRASR
ncbi:MAG: thioredoxin [Alteromonadaceae bacterium]|nr:MAG: thioredoxin [Alteromonadaceae bacterium]